MDKRLHVSHPANKLASDGLLTSDATMNASDEKSQITTAAPINGNTDSQTSIEQRNKYERESHAENPKCKGRQNDTSITIYERETPEGRFLTFLCDFSTCILLAAMMCVFSLLVRDH